MKKKENEIEEYFKCQNYRNIKKQLFKFNGIWSYQEYFYDYEKYKLKYKLLNHMTNDFTKIFMTPIIDVDYYIPKFSKCKTDIFRNNSDSMIIPITKATDLCLELKDKRKNISNINLKNNTNTNNDKDNTNAKTENKLEISANSHTSFDSLNNSSVSNISEIKQDYSNSNSNINNIKQNIPLYELNQENYPYLKEIETKEIDNLPQNTNTNTNINNFNE